MQMEQRTKKTAPICVLSYMNRLEKNKYVCGKSGTAGLYKATHNRLKIISWKKEADNETGRRPVGQ